MPKLLPIANRINLLRHKRRMTTAQISVALDVPLHTYQNWERKDGPYPRTESLVTLAQFFGTSVDYLVGLTDDPRPAPCGS